MGLMINQKCVTDATDAKFIIDAQFPQHFMSGTTFTTLSLNTSTLNFNTGVYTFSIKYPSGTVISGQSETYLQCTDGNLTQALPDLIFILACVIVFFITFGIGYKR